MYVLDTNLVSELRRPDKADKNVSAWFASLPAECFFLSAISLLELDIGALSIARRDKIQGDMLQAWIDYQVVPLFAGRILPVDVAVARCCARLHVPDPRAERDAMIAATAIVHSMTIATRNVADFAPTGVAIFNPWTGQKLHQ